MRKLFFNSDLIKDKDKFSIFCKFGTTLFKAGDIHHSLYRSYLKFLED